MCPVCTPLPHSTIHMQLWPWYPFLNMTVPFQQAYPVRSDFVRPLRTMRASYYMWIALYPSTVLFRSRETLVLKLHCSGLPHLYTQCPTLLPASTGQVTPSGGKKWPRLASPDPASLPFSLIGSSLWVPSFTAQWIYPVPNLPNRPSHLCIKTSHLFASKLLSAF